MSTFFNCDVSVDNLSLNYYINIHPINYYYQTDKSERQLLITACSHLILLNGCSGEGPSTVRAPCIRLIFDPLVKAVFVELVATVELCNRRVSFKELQAEAALVSLLGLRNVGVILDIL